VPEKSSASASNTARPPAKPEIGIEHIQGFQEILQPAVG
jgi:hypothetical protein